MYYCIYSIEILLKIYLCKKLLKSNFDVKLLVTGRNWLSKAWNLCDPLESKSNVTDLKDYLIDLYGNLAMVNYPYPANFLAPLPGHPVKVSYNLYYQ